MKTENFFLIGINAKFIHSNLAIRYIKKYAEDRGQEIDLMEYTINQDIDYVMEQILLVKPKWLGFSCYLWNIEMIKKLVVAIKKIQPDIGIVFGGPEVSYNSEDWLTTLPIDVVVRGEGEVSTYELVQALRGQGDLSEIDGISYKVDGQIYHNQAVQPMPMNDVPFVYDGEELAALEHRILYYETSRGCPYNCQYCLSSIEKGVRFKDLSLVYKELQFFLDHKVVQVKFVDRTFNAKKSHALGIWQYLMEHDNGHTNFHFEITADLMTYEIIDILKDARPGLFQFEIGVQSTNSETIVDIDRKVDFEQLKQYVLAIKAGNNIHLHLDLIAGLPKEDYAAFATSFNDVMVMRPEQLQLGFLKVLAGSQMNALKEHYGIVHRDYAPYEVLYTKEMSYETLRRLKHIEDVLETYYNSNQFTGSMDYLMRCHSHDFACYEKLTDYLMAQGYFDMPHNKMQLFDWLYQYGMTCQKVDHAYLADLLKHDLCLREKPKKWPAFVNRQEKVTEVERQFYNSDYHRAHTLKGYTGLTGKQISRIGHLETYDYPVHHKEITPQRMPIWLFYDYRDRDPLTYEAKVTLIDIDELKKETIKEGESHE